MLTDIHEAMVTAIAKATGGRTSGWAKFFRAAALGTDRIAFGFQHGSSSDRFQCSVCGSRYDCESCLRRPAIAKRSRWDAVYYDNTSGSRLLKLRPDVFCVSYCFADEKSPFPILHLWEVSHTTNREVNRYLSSLSLLDEYFPEVLLHVVHAATGVTSTYTYADLLQITLNREKTARVRDLDNDRVAQATAVFSTIQ